ncbi:GNAT family N-acetyltransferase [Streptomyces wedmorensis]|uniref:GNAT family N-acetyltransferase n=1 Tax=Streptomyces wedmorensis TaxID=43759 RepID=A0ABW6J5R2_STRWE
MRHAETAAPVGAWTLEFIGVRPDTAGRGAGRYLLDHVLAATPAQAGFFLTTADPANVPLYRRFGFVDLRRTTLGPLDVRAMVKPGAGTRPGPARPQAPARTPLRRR